MEASEQLKLPFEKPSAIAVLVRSIDWQVTGLSEHCWRQVREILIAVVYCGSQTGCYAQRETLLRVANDHRDRNCEAIASLRSFDRRHGEAIKLGLLSIHRRYKKTAHRCLVVERVRALVSLSNAKAQQARQASARADLSGETTGKSVASQWQVSGETTGDSLTKETNTNSPELSTTQKTGRRATKDEIGQIEAQIDLESARQAAKFWPEFRGGTDRDWQLLLKCCWLSGRRLSEHWLHDALEGVRRSRPKNRWALFWHLVKQGAEHESQTLVRLLARLEVPGEYERPPRRVERLCVDSG